MKLHLMTCGSIELDGGYATPGHNPGQVMRVAVGMFLLEHPRGLILIDTGNHPLVARNPTAYWGRETADWIKPSMSAADAVDRQLTRLGFAVKDVSHVALTHLHLDHAGAMSLFPHACFFIQKDELLAAAWPEQLFDRGYYELKDFASSRRFNIVKLDSDHDVFDDGTVMLLKTGGHSAGHQMALLNLPETGPCLLPGDAAFMPEQLELNCTPGHPIPDPEAALRAIATINQMQTTGTKLIFSHPRMELWNKMNHGLLK